MHTAVISNTAGRNIDQWARPLRANDFELLCKNGTRKTIEAYKSCHLLRVPARNMLNFAQQLFGSDTNKEFAMFDSFYEHPDLMFLNDATVQLTCITTSLDDYLSPDIIQLLHRTDPQM
ncbi:unnamed protein product, partial [Rotaria sp. Silwood1]